VDQDQVDGADAVAGPDPRLAGTAAAVGMMKAKLEGRNPNDD
jgi:hypothetical protein